MSLSVWSFILQTKSADVSLAIPRRTDAVSVNSGVWSKPVQFFIDIVGTVKRSEKHLWWFHPGSNQ